MAQTEDAPSRAELDSELHDDVWDAAIYVADRQGGSATPADVMATWIAADPDRADDFLAWAELS